MGKGSGLFKFGMIRKLVLMNILFFIAFGGTVLAVLYAFRNIESLSKTLIDENITRVIANEQLGRDLGKVLSDTDLLVGTFLYGAQNVEKEGERITASAALLETQGDTVHLKGHLRELTGVLHSLFQTCAVVKEYSGRLDAHESKLNKELTSLEETLSEKLISRVMERKDTSIMEQLSIITPGYRETLLQISLEHVKLCLRRPGQNGRDTGRFLLPLLDDLRLRLRTITASEPGIAGYGTRLMDEVSAYRKDTVLLQQSLSELERRLVIVTGVKKCLVEDMRAVDARVSRTSGEALGRVASIMGASRSFVVVTSVVVISLLAVFSAYFILANIRRPMSLIRRGIESIREGNLETRIRLDRNDEWSVIEQAVNDMVTDLRTSYGNLQGMNSELETARSQLQDKVMELENQMGERERAESELKTSEQKWHSLFENLPGGSFTVNDNYIIEDVNDVLCAVTGFRREELIGQLCGIICPKGPHKCPIFDLGQERIDNNETAVKARDGKLVPIIKSARRIPVGHKDVIVENFQDITDRKYLEEQLHHASKMEAVGQLAGGVAHDFNNILTAIIGYGTLLQTRFPAGDPSRAKVDQILGAAERASNLTRSLLTLSRKRVVELQPLRLNDCVSGMEGLLSRLIREDIEFRTLVPEEVLTVLGDKTQVEQILINLITNARDSMPEGGAVTLRLTSMEMHDGFTVSAIPEGTPCSAFRIWESEWMRRRGKGSSSRFIPPRGPEKVPVWAWQ
jgi:PAS domain S-box-containing protein